MKPSEFDAVCKLFQNASNGFKRVNPGLAQLDRSEEIKTIPVSFRDLKRPIPSHMNKTEQEFALRLEAERRSGEITRYEYEGITLRWADMRYTPDFVVFSYLSPVPVMIEVKGGFIRDRDIVRFKGCRAVWPEFGFQMWQLIKGQWKRKF